ncbi:MAG: alkene reductase [Nevskia sp.]|nr:alkene reductase [Nevskia sp.]
MLHSPVTLGALRLPNRVLMAPLTRMRADAARVPTPMVAEYYAQRAGAGLVIAEATSVSPRGHGYPNTPGIHTDAQQAGWNAVTDAVHAAGGRIFLQLWHVGRISHSSHQPDGGAPVSSSAVKAKGRVVTADYKQEDLPVPRPLELHEIPGVVAEYEAGARRAKAAGFDGVEIHNANGYLLDQFLRDGVNQRTDRYGGSLENRVRLCLEVAEAVTGVWGADRVGIRLSPSGTSNDMRDSNPREVFSYLLRELSRFGLAYAHVTQATEDDLKRGSPGIPVADFRPHFKGPMISAGGFTRETGEQALREGWLDAVVYGQLFISNPDLPERFALGAPLTEPDKKTYYTPGPHGYTDYPRHQA